MRAGETGVSESAALAHVFVLLHGNKHRLAVAQRFNRVMGPPALIHSTNA